MKRILALAFALVVMAGCASIPKTVTYTVMEMREVEEAQPPVARSEHPDVASAIQEEIVEVPQPPKVVVVQADIPKEFPGAKDGRKYLHIGYRPVNPNREITGDEKEFILPIDAYVSTPDRYGKVSNGWLISGERVIGVPTSDPDYYKAVWIRRCGNPILNDGKIALYFKVRRESIPQPSVKIIRPKPQPTRAAAAPPQPPIKRWVQVPVLKERTLTCQERKAEVSGWRKGLAYVVTGVGGAGGAVLGGIVSHSPHGVQVGAGVGVLIGRLIGGATDGSDCVDSQDVTEGIVLGVAAYAIAPQNAVRVAPVAQPHPHPGNGGGHTLPPNGGGGYAPPINPVTGHTLPPNGPPISGGYAPVINPVTGHTLPVN